MGEEKGLHNRLKQAIVWLKANKNMMQRDIAQQMGMTEVGFSRGIARCKERRDEEFVIKFHQATGEIFSLEWLLDGTGPKFTEQAEQKPREPAIIDSSSALNAAISAYVVAIDAKDAQIAQLNDQLKDKNKIIEQLEARIAELKHAIAQYSSTDREHYPFPVGTAEDKNQRKSL